MTEKPKPLEWRDLHEWSEKDGYYFEDVKVRSALLWAVERLTFQEEKYAKQEKDNLHGYGQHFLHAEGVDKKSAYNHAIRILKRAFEAVSRDG